LKCDKEYLNAVETLEIIFNTAIWLIFYYYYFRKRPDYRKN